MSKTHMLLALAITQSLLLVSFVFADGPLHHDSLGQEHLNHEDDSDSAIQRRGLMFPDLIPFVDEQRPYLANWDLQGDTLRIQSVFGNIGDGVFEIRRSDAPPVDGRFDVLQRVYDTSDPFGTPTDFFANTAVYHGGHGHIHFEDMSDFDLFEVTDDGGVLGAGARVAGVSKVSTNLHDITSLGNTARWGDYTGFPSFEGGNSGLRQIVSVGHGDVYNYGTSGQSFSIQGVPRGPYYWLQQKVDPTDVIMETNEANNSFEVLIDLTRPGEAVLKDDGTFFQFGDPADMLPGLLGDMDLDSDVDGDDWLIFVLGIGTDDPGITDLDGDGRNSHSDFVLFRDVFESLNGNGSFTDMLATVPEPTTLGLLMMAGAMVVLRRRPRT